MTSVLEARRRFNRVAALSLLAAVAGPSASRAHAQGAGAKSSRRVVIQQALPGQPDRDLLLVEVTYPAGTGSPAHLHANGVMAFVISGSIASKVDDEPEKIFQTGDAWWEPPGAVHHVSRNVSKTEPATLLAIYIAPKGAAPEDLMKVL
jgi:quercetin dioxygenase-like cupin family protein